MLKDYCERWSALVVICVQHCATSNSTKEVLAQIKASQSKSKISKVGVFVFVANGPIDFIITIVLLDILNLLLNLLVVAIFVAFTSNSYLKYHHNRRAVA